MEPPMSAEDLVDVHAHFLTPIGVDAQLASIDAAAGPSPDRTWRQLTGENARRLFPRLGASAAAHGA
jgi:hypothetical protein